MEEDYPKEFRDWIGGAKPNTGIIKNASLIICTFNKSLITVKCMDGNYRKVWNKIYLN